MLIDKLRSLKKNKIYEQLIIFYREQFNLKMQFSSGKLKQTHLLKKIRKQISRTKTIFMEKRHEDNG
ncbi:50S ribosomal protein L29 [Buchnera aphidicola]|uniref:Large ribosomal subunit protein uL29 n=1 Tax=Buchnera aphidicola (Anoecia oenotherae) TaxID=1241833 RepID=A0A4D6Y511_9GAMM|nr:50S ribosomal protein L29 [Buchnera aphidicola (Anoecia oenotherae)]